MKFLSCPVKEQSTHVFFWVHLCIRDTRPEHLNILALITLNYQVKSNKQITKFLAV